MGNYCHTGEHEGTVDYLMPERNHLQIFKDIAAF